MEQVTIHKSVKKVASCDISENVVLLPEITLQRNKTHWR